MSETTDLWAGSVQAAGGYGGWGWLAVRGGEAQGAAGGDRRTTGLAMTLTALIAALETVDRAAPLKIHVAETALRGDWDAAAAEAPEAAALFGKLRAALEKQAGGWALAPGHEEGAAFCAAWAAFALDIARTKGAFSSPIPKPNLKTVVGKIAT